MPENTNLYTGDNIKIKLSEIECECAGVDYSNLVQDKKWRANVSTKWFCYPQNAENLCPNSRELLPAVTHSDATAAAATLRAAGLPMSRPINS